MKKTNVFMAITVMTMLVCVFILAFMPSNTQEVKYVDSLFMGHIYLNYKLPVPSFWWNMLVFPMSIFMWFSIYDYNGITGKEPNGYNDQITAKYHVRISQYFNNLLTLVAFGLFLLIGLITIIIFGYIDDELNIYSALVVSTEAYIFLYLFVIPLVVSFMFLINSDWEHTLSERYVTYIVTLSKNGIVKSLPLILWITAMFTVILVIKWIVKPFTMVRVSLKKS